MIVSISKGYQLTIPAEIRNAFGLGTGSKVDVRKKDKKIIIEPIKEDIDQVFSDAKKIKPKHRLNAKQMDKLVEDAVY